MTLQSFLEIGTFPSCRRVILFSCLVPLFASFLQAEKVDEKGKEWLERHSEPAAVNVTGVWVDPNWGNITLDQPQGSRRITGDGDEWKINGVVSGNKVFLLFSFAGDVTYSAVLDFVTEDTIKGRYAGGLKEKPNESEILLQRRSHAIVQPELGSKSETARMIVYQKWGTPNGSIYLDGRQLVWSRSAYFSFNVAPGSHKLYMKVRSRYSYGPSRIMEYTEIDARAGDTYYIEAVFNYGFQDQREGLKLVSEEKGRKDIKKKKPLEAKYVVADSIVLLDKIQIK
jgi:hypothetical protein